MTERGLEGRVGWRGALALAISMIAGASNAQPNGCQMIKVNELPVTMRGNQPVVDVEVNGQRAAMMIDTGSVATVLFPAAAERLGLGKAGLDYANYGADISLYGVGGGGRPGVARLRELKIGDTTTRDTSILVSGSKRGLGAADGLLGRQYLLQSDLEIDLAHGAIRFFKPKNCSGDQVLYWGGAYAVSPMRSTNIIEGVDLFVALNGVALSATLDSGASETVVTRTGAMRAGIRSDAMTPVGASYGVGPRGVATYSALFQSFGFGDEVIKNARLSVADLYQHAKEVFVGSHIPTALIDTTQMLLGADFLKSHRVYIARSQGRVYASYIGGPVFAPIVGGGPPVTPRSTP